MAASFYGRSRLPFASPQNSPNPPLQLPGATQAAADLSCSSNKSLRPWQCPFKEVQGSRSPAFKTRLNSPNPPLQLPGATQAAADLSCSSHKCLRPWQCLFMDVQGCRLPAFKTPQTFPCSSQAPLRPRQTFPAAPTSPRPWQCLFVDVQGCRLPASKTPQTLPCSSQAPLRPRHTFPAAPTSPWSRGSVPFKEVQGSRSPAFKTRQNSPNPPLQLPGATQAAADLSCSSNKSLRPWQCPFMEVQGCLLPAFETRLPPQTLPCSSQAPLRPRQTFPAALTSPSGRGSVFYGRSRLPFASPQNSPNPPLQLPGATQAAADLSCSSNKSLRPWQCPFKEVQASLQNSPNPPLQLPGATQAAADLSCSSNKFLRPWQCPFTEVPGCRLPAFKTRQIHKPSPAAPRCHLGRGRPFLQLQQVPEAVAVSF